MQWRMSLRWGPQTINNSSMCLSCVPLSIGRLNSNVFALSGVFLSSLIDEMDSKEREREEN